MIFINYIINKLSLDIFISDRALKIFLLGCISGYPWVLIGSSLSLWLKDDGFSRSSIGWAGLIFSVYAVNFLWAPFIDRVKIPFITKKFGHRKSWIFLLQSLIIIMLILWSFLDPKQNLLFVIFIGLMIAIFSATQDITLDALRIEQINSTEKKMIAAGASMMVVGWWTGFKLGGLISLLVSDLFQNFKLENHWQITFLVLAIIMSVLNVGVFFINEKSKKNDQFLKKSRSSFKSNNHNSKIFKNICNYFSWITFTWLSPITSF